MYSERDEVCHLAVLLGLDRDASLSRALAHALRRRSALLDQARLRRAGRQVRRLW